jgi:hypothetical protein
MLHVGDVNVLPALPQRKREQGQACPLRDQRDRHPARTESPQRPTAQPKLAGRSRLSLLVSPDESADATRLPKRLYKFRPLSTPAQQGFLRTVIVTSELFFANSNHFLDPFEFRYANPTNVATPAGTVERDNVLESASDVGILSFSATREHLLMWSHYADWHRGICLGFDVDVSCAFFQRARPVLYGNAYSSSTESLGHLLAKSTQWSHEAEWRIFEPHAGGQLRPFPAETLAEIILGCRIEPTHEQLVREWIAERTPPVRLFRAVPSAAQFSLRFEAADQ